jgi:uncharacterized protein (TIGR02391 family)
VVLAYEDVRNLPLPDLSLRLLKSLGGEPNFNNLIQGFKQREGYGSPQPSDIDAMLARLSDAWAWLESHALVGPSSKNPPGGWHRVTATGAELANDPKAAAKIWAADRLAGELHPTLSSARSNFALGDYETASFAAMKAVEVEVRRVAALPNDLLGVNLMRKAFGPKDGALSDPEAEGGEQQATADLFAGAIGAYKNPASHRAVQFDDPIEVAEVIQLADFATTHCAKSRVPTEGPALGLHGMRFTEAGGTATFGNRTNPGGLADVGAPDAYWLVMDILQLSCDASAWRFGKMVAPGKTNARSANA